MADRPLIVHTCPASRKMRRLLIAGSVLEVVGIGLAVAALTGALGDGWLNPGGVLALMGLGMQVMAILCGLRSPAFVFDAEKRTIVERQVGGARREVGRFEDFKGVDVLAEVRADKLDGTELYEVHRTYPDQSMMAFAVCLVGTKGPVRMVQKDARADARALQEQIVRYCAWTHRGSSVPDSNRALPQRP